MSTFCNAQIKVPGRVFASYQQCVLTKHWQQTDKKCARQLNSIDEHDAMFFCFFLGTR